MSNLFNEVKKDAGQIQGLLQKQIDTFKDQKTLKLDDVLAQQSQNVIRRLRQLKSVTPEQSMELQELLMDGPWTSEQKASMVSLLTNAVGMGGQGGPSMRQTVTSFAAYLSPTDVATLSNPDVNSYVKIDVLASRAMSIGLTRPSEPSFRNILAAGSAHGLSISPQERLPFLNELKRKLRKVSMQSTVQHYPATPAELDSEMLEAAYGADDRPSQCQEAVAAALAAQGSLPWRRSSKNHVRLDGTSTDLQVIPATSRISSSSSSMQGQEGGFMNMMTQMSQIATMAQNPMFMQMMMMMMMGGGRQQQQSQEVPLQMFPKKAPAEPCKSPPSTPGSTAVDGDSQPQQQEIGDLQPKELFDLGLGHEDENSHTPNTSVETQATVMELALQKRQSIKDVAKEDVNASKPAGKKPDKAVKDKAAPKTEIKKSKKDPEITKAKPEKKMDRKNIHSRAYQAAKGKYLKEGKSHQEACEAAAEDAAMELRRHGFEPHPKKRPTKK